MRAVVITQFGEADVLELREMPEPQPSAGQVSIDVAYAGVNYAEVLYRRGMVDVPLPFTPGIEVSGHIKALGEGVDGLQVGQPVAALTAVNSGGYAEVVTVPALLTFPLDKLDSMIDLPIAAASPSNVTTAYMILTNVVELRSGASVLGHAAAGGVGSVLGQMARALGAGYVYGTVGRTDKIAFAKSLGYDEVLLRNDFVSHIQTLTNDEGVDIVIDPVGGTIRTLSLDVLRPLGKLVVMGNASNADDVQLSANSLWFSSKGILGFNVGALSRLAPMAISAAGREALNMVANGQVRVEVTDILPLEQAKNAHRRIEVGDTTGKIVLKVQP